jgi:hypothetical protein
MAATPAVTAVDTEATPVMVVDTEDTAAAAATAVMAVATTGPAMVAMEDTEAETEDMEATVDIGKITTGTSCSNVVMMNNSATNNKDIIRF